LNKYKISVNSNQITFTPFKYTVFIDKDIPYWFIGDVVKRFQY